MDAGTQQAISVIYYYLIYTNDEYKVDKILKYCQLF